MSKKYTVTIDHCCLIDIEMRRPDAPYVEALVDAWKCGRIDLAVTAMGATENTKGYFPVKNYEEFRQNLRDIGLGDVPEIFPFARFELSFWGKAMWACDQTMALEKKIWDILFPNCPWGPDFKWKSPLKRTDENDKRTREYGRWVNQLCDVHLVLSHAHARREVLVTRDKVLLNGNAELQDLGPDLGVGEIMTPRDLLALMESGCCKMTQTGCQGKG